MTVQEAKCKQCTKKCPQEKMASEIAKGRMYATNEFIQCQKELEQYRALGTVEELKEAREKQIPKKITRRYMKNINGDVIATSCYCPICDEYLQEEYPEYCSNCGQALKWGEEDDE